jgi:CheY-like chemotaxis protein
MLNKVLENAVEHSPEGGEVIVAVESEGGLVRMSVRDSGSGIDAAIREKIFFPFFSTKKGVRGAGLGLAIVHGIAVRHSAQVKVHSRPGRGTTIEIAFTRRTTQREQSDVSRRRRTRDNLAVLVVDDDRQIREILSDMLVIDGHSATACCDAYEALEALDQAKFDLMITDLGMPGMSGLDLAGMAHDKHPEMPIAMITGWGTQLDEKETALKGVQTVLAKPFHLADIKRMIRALVTE